MARVAQTVRSTRTRSELQRAALARFLAQGVEDTSVDEIAADAGVTARTFYRHFASKHDVLFADYDAGLTWFRAALAARPPGEPVIASVQAAIFTFPYDVEAISQIASLRAAQVDHGRVAGHLRRVEADLADAITDHLVRASPPETPDEQLAVTVTARCIAAATFGAMDAWMLHTDRSLPELARLCHRALDQLAHGLA